MLLALLLAGSPSFAAPPAPAPAGAVRTALTDVRLGPGEAAARVHLLCEDGRIRAVLPAAEPVPPGYYQVAGEGRRVVPAFIDAYTHAGTATPEPVADRDLPTDVSADVDVAMRAANRKGVQPAFRAVDVLALREKLAREWREQGFGALLSAPHGHLLSGWSALATTREAAARDVVVRAAAFQHAAFAASGPGYPSTLMGYVAQLRQYFLDAGWHAELGRRAAAQNGARPPYDRELELGAELLAGRRLWCEAELARDIERWIGLADEFGLSIGIVGGREAWRLAGLLAEREIPVVLTLEWGDEVRDPDAKRAKGREGAAPGAPPEEHAGESPGEQGGEPTEQAGEPVEPAGEQTGEQAGAAAAGAQPEDAEPEQAEPLYAEPLAVQRERRRVWLEGRDCALRLAEAGVPFAFGSGGSDAKKLVGKVRELVEAGLDAELALAALTETAALIVEVPGVLGALEPGCDATFAVWSEHPLRSKKAQLAALFVDGEPYEFEPDGEPELEGEPAEGVDLSGRWTLTFEGGGQSVEMRLELEMQPDGELAGTFEREDPTGAAITGELGGKVAGRQVRFEGSYTLGEAAVEFVFDGALEGGALEGRMHVEGAFGELDADAHGERSPDARGAEERR